MADKDKRTKFVKRAERCDLKSIKRRSREFVRQRRNRLRKARRKRSLTRYYSRLRNLRTTRSSDELSDAISVCDITDMEWTQCAPLNDALRDVADWHKQDQIAYWKSRALSLELENRMLHNCIRNAYVKQIQDYENYVKMQNTSPVVDGVTHEEKKCNEALPTVAPDKLPPPEQVGEARRREMRQLYGSMTPKIIGMETAVQLNYDLQLDQHRPRYWPNIPLNL